MMIFEPALPLPVRRAAFVIWIRTKVSLKSNQYMSEWARERERRREDYKLKKWMINKTCCVINGIKSQVNAGNRIKATHEKEANKWSYYRNLLHWKSKAQHENQCQPFQIERTLWLSTKKRESIVIRLMYHRLVFLNEIISAFNLIV